MEFPRGARFTPPKLRFALEANRVLFEKFSRYAQSVGANYFRTGDVRNWRALSTLDAHGPAGPAHHAAANTMLAMASRYAPPDWRLSAVTMVAKPFHDRAAAAPEAKTANVSNATAITTNWSATAV